MKMYGKGSEFWLLYSYSLSQLRYSDPSQKRDGIIGTSEEI